MSVPPGRPAQQLTPPRILLVVVVALLVLLLGVLLLQRTTSGGDDPGPGANDTRSAPVEGDADDATATAEESPGTAEESPAPSKGAGPTYFASPSGNIACSITADSADCVIASFSYEPAGAAQCDAEDVGGHLRVEEAGASMPCDPLVVAGNVPDLGYGEEITAHGFTCSSQEAGVTCRHDGSGHGFTVARAAYDLF